MEQQTKSKLAMGTLFAILLIVVYFGNIGTMKVSNELVETNQKLDHLITEIRVLKSKVDKLEQKTNAKLYKETQNSAIAKSNKIEQEKNVSVEALTPKSENLKENNSLVDVSVVNTERVECCEGDDWGEVQEVRIREVINTEIAVETDLTINSIVCEEQQCEISLTIHDETGVKGVAKTMGKLSPKGDKENTIDLKNIQFTSNGVEAIIRLYNNDGSE